MESMAEFYSFEKVYSFLDARFLLVEAHLDNVINLTESPGVLRDNQYDQQGSSNRILLKGGDLCVDGSRLRLRSQGC